MDFFYRINENFIQNGTLQVRRYVVSGFSYTVVTEETVDEVEKYFQKIQILPLEKLLKYKKDCKKIIETYWNYIDIK